MASNRKTNIGIVAVAGVILAVAGVVAAIGSGNSSPDGRTRNAALPPVVVDNFTEVGPATHDVSTQAFRFECSANGSCTATGTVTGSANTLMYRPSFITLRSGVWKWASDDRVKGLESDSRTNWVSTASACDSTSTCAATSSFDLYGWQPGLHRIGTDGQATRLPDPALTDSGLRQVGPWIVDLVCPAVGACVGAGRAFTATGSQQPTIFEVNQLTTSPTWKFSTWPLPGNAKIDQPEKTKIACSSAGRCLAVFPNSTLSYVVQKTNGIWSAPGAVQLPSDAAPQPNGWFQDVACSPNGTCSVVGTYYDSKSYSRMFVTTYSASGTLISAKKIVTGRDSQSIGSVSTTFTKLSLECPIDNSCVIAGNFTMSGSPSAVVVEQTAGNWPDQASFIFPPGNSAPFGTDLAFNGSRPDMRAISCSPDGQLCMVLMRAGLDDVRLIRWQGSWSLTTKVTPAPMAAQDFGYLALDCPASNQCHGIWWRGGASKLLANSMTISSSSAVPTTPTDGSSGGNTNTATTVPPAKPMNLKVGKTLTNATILRLALAQAPAQSVRSVVISAQPTAVCKKSSKGVSAVKVGTCRIAVSGTAKGGVKWKTSLRITVVK